MIAAPHVTVRPALAAERPLIEGLFQFYVYDFSEFALPDSPNFEFNDQGRFAAYPLDDYWRSPARWPLLIRANGQPAGFALINTQSHSGGPVDRNMAEFFVARKFRRRGVATSALRQMLAMHPGKWEVAVVERNAGAQAFWPRAIGDAPGVSDLVCFEVDGESWRGPIWNFQV